MVLAKKNRLCLTLGFISSPPTIAYIILYVLGFISIDQPKNNQNLQPIQQTSRSALSIWSPKWSNGSNPSYKTLDSKLPMLQFPSMRTFNVHLIFIKSHHLTSRVKYIAVSINYFHEKYVLLTIDHVKLKTNIHPEDIGTKSSTVSLLK